MTPEERETLVEQVAGAHRERDPRGGLQPHRAWSDLDEAGRREAFDLGRQLRRLEAALDADGLSAAGRAVLARIEGR